MFEKYSSIDNHYNNKLVESIKNQGYGDIPYVVREKLHGTNFSVIYDDSGQFQFCKRSGPINEGESFFGWQEIAEDLKEKVAKLHKNLSNTYGDIKIQLYGELVGPGVQRGVNYGPKALYVFDIRVAYLAGEEEKSWFLDDWVVEKVCHEVGLNMAPLIGKFSSLDEAMALDVEGKTSIVPGATNDFQIEGYVIKSEKVHHLYTGKRIILKLKSKEHLEKSGKPKIPKVREPMADSDLEALEQLEQYITANRVNNVLSKIGEFEPKLIPRIMGETVQDAIVDWEKDTGKVFRETIIDPKRLSKSLAADVRTLIIDSYMS